jgi:hypothetical protein
MDPGLRREDESVVKDIGLVSRWVARYPVKSEVKHMQKHIGWFWMIGFFGLIATADAQTASPPAASTQFDGTYAFVSRTKMNETYAVTRSNRIGQCGGTGKGNHRRPLTIASGQAQYTTAWRCDLPRPRNGQTSVMRE